MEKKIIYIIKQNCNIEQIEDINIDFTAIGVDSITFINIIVALEQEFDIEFDDEMLLISQYSNVKEFIEYVTNKVGRNVKNE